jgi:hypothetical protein
MKKNSNVSSQIKLVIMLTIVSLSQISYADCGSIEITVKNKTSSIWYESTTEQNNLEVQNDYNWFVVPHNYTNFIFPEEPKNNYTFTVKQKSFDFNPKKIGINHVQLDFNANDSSQSCQIFIQQSVCYTLKKHPINNTHVAGNCFISQATSPNYYEKTPGSTIVTLGNAKYVSNHNENKNNTDYPES